jgi:hypothetical protein
MTDAPAVPATATEARTVLDARIADKSFADRIFAGDVAAKNELAALHAKIHAGGADVIGAAMDGKLPDVPSSKERQLVGATEWFRELGIRDEVTSQFLKGEKVTPTEYEMFSNWKKTAMGDNSSGGFVERYLAGNTEAKQKMLIANSVLTNGIRDEKAA